MKSACLDNCGFWIDTEMNSLMCDAHQVREIDKLANTYGGEGSRDRWRPFYLCSLHRMQSECETLQTVTNINPLFNLPAQFSLCVQSDSLPSLRSLLKPQTVHCPSRLAPPAVSLHLSMLFTHWQHQEVATSHGSPSSAWVGKRAPPSPLRVSWRARALPSMHSS